MTADFLIGSRLEKSDFTVYVRLRNVADDSYERRALVPRLHVICRSVHAQERG